MTSFAKTIFLVGCIFFCSGADNGKEKNVRNFFAFHVLTWQARLFQTVQDVKQGFGLLPASLSSPHTNMGLQTRFQATYEPKKRRRTSGSLLLSFPFAPRHTQEGRERARVQGSIVQWKRGPFEWGERSTRHGQANASLR